MSSGKLRDLEQVKGNEFFYSSQFTFNLNGKETIILFAETAVSLGKHTAHKQEVAFLLVYRVSNTQSAGHIWPV